MRYTFVEGTCAVIALATLKPRSLPNYRIWKNCTFCPLRVTLKYLYIVLFFVSPSPQLSQRKPLKTIGSRKLSQNPAQSVHFVLGSQSDRGHIRLHIPLSTAQAFVSRNETIPSYTRLQVNISIHCRLQISGWQSIIPHTRWNFLQSHQSTRTVSCLLLRKTYHIPCKIRS